MGKLAKKTTILFDPEEFERMKRTAKERGCSVGELIRVAIRELQRKSDPEQRKAAVRELGRLSLPAGSWEDMEKETIGGATE